MGDPIDDMSHDHAELNHRVLALASQLRRGPQEPGTRDLVAPLTELRDLLFLHFAQEEEGLFPFVSDALSDLEPQVRRMEIAHDTICGSLARMCHMATFDGPRTAVAALFDRFESLYAEHAKAEGDLLASLDRRLDPGQRDALASLVTGL